MLLRFFRRTLARLRSRSVDPAERDRVFRTVEAAFSRLMPGFTGTASDVLALYRDRLVVRIEFQDPSGDITPPHRAWFSVTRDTLVASRLPDFEGIKYDEIWE
ncbi:MAG: hypothetical protein CVU65_00520 [Deltaproteobacteria bacterium HGW-Deltaproteobacteria-22]|jgi:hypothetical protein|nr:hypothetical protein [Myxococcota bacterium]PKN27973.1 MAG: hypothetical protein CVU65_00520 [Deltaproteobacteria bacterium HGW-Deltaproteobacteria-22]